MIWSIFGGDDWNDKPYECNAGEPYDSWGELIEDNPDIFKRKWRHHEIKHKILYFDIDSYELPCDGYLNSPYSVEEINKGKVPWVETDNYKIYAGTTYEEFIKVIEDNGGDIYIKRGE